MEYLANIRNCYDCIPQPRYAKETESFKYLVVHGRVHQTVKCNLVGDGFGRV